MSRALHTLRVLILACALTCGAAAAPALTVSTFDTDLDGWTTDNGGAFTHQASGGDPGGFLQLDNDESLIAHIFAPAAFLGNRSGDLGTTFAFEGMLVAGGGGFYEASDDYGVVRLTGGGFSVTADLAPDGEVPPLAGWHTYSVTLDAASFGTSGPTMAAVLADLTAISITIEGLFGAEVEGIDNVVLGGAPGTTTSSTLATTTSSVASTSSTSSTSTTSSTLAGSTTTTSVATTSTTSTTLAAPVCALRYEPSYGGALRRYGYASDLMYVKAKTGRICRDCGEAPRGVLLRATRSQPGFGFVQYGVPLGSPVVVHAVIDVTKLMHPGVVAGVELDSPAVPVGQTPPSFLFAGVSRAADGSLTAFANHDGTTVGTPASSPGSVGAVELQLTFDADQVGVVYGTIPPSGSWSILDGLPFVHAGSAGLGAGLSNASKPDAVGVAVAISGDIFTEVKQGLLCDLQSAIDLEVAALTALDAGHGSEASDKLDQARSVIEMGTPVPDSDPPAFTGGLTGRTDALFADNPQVAKAVDKDLADAVKRDAQAGKQIEHGKLDKAKKSVDGAIKRKARAKARIETGNKSEREGAL